MTSAKAKEAESVKYCISLPKAWVDKLCKNKIFRWLLTMLAGVGISFGTMGIVRGINNDPTTSTEETIEEEEKNVQTPKKLV